MAKGKQLYDANCIQCHGAEGKGDGYGAPFLVPPPRDFTAGQFKFRTTAGGLLPTDDDLFRTISRGANGTGMPPWKYLLNDEERWALVEYVKSFEPRFATARALKPMPLPDAPGKSRSADRGREVYAKMQCSKCHGEDGRGVGPSSNAMVDAKGRHVNARDFTQPGSYRTGWTEREIIRTLETGMNGVPMPSYTGVMSKQEEYDLVAYLMSIAGPGSGNQKRQLAKSMEGARRARSRHHAARARVEVRAVGDSRQARRSRADRLLRDRQRPRRRTRLRARRARSERVHQRRDGRCAAVGHVQGRHARTLQLLLRDAVQHHRAASQDARRADRRLTANRLGPERSGPWS